MSESVKIGEEASSLLLTIQRKYHCDSTEANRVLELMTHYNPVSSAILEQLEYTVRLGLVAINHSKA